MVNFFEQDFLFIESLLFQLTNEHSRSNNWLYQQSCAIKRYIRRDPDLLIKVIQFNQTNALLPALQRQYDSDSLSVARGQDVRWKYSHFLRTDKGAGLPLIKRHFPGTILLRIVAGTLT